MVKIILLAVISLTFLNASSFEQNCLSCHGNDFKFNMMMKKYTQKYSSEKRIKEAIFDYLKEPLSTKSILPSEYIQRFGIKEKSNLDDKTLKRMIDIYYEKFNLRSKLY